MTTNSKIFAAVAAVAAVGLAGWGVSGFFGPSREMQYLQAAEEAKAAERALDDLFADYDRHKKAMDDFSSSHFRRVSQMRGMLVDSRLVGLGDEHAEKLKADIAEMETKYNELAKAEGDRERELVKRIEAKKQEVSNARLRRDVLSSAGK